MRFLKRNLAHIDVLLEAYKTFPLKHKEQKYLMVLHTVYDQQEEIHRTNTHRVVNIRQPHVRPIVRGKENAKTDPIVIGFGRCFVITATWIYDFFITGTMRGFSSNIITVTAAQFLKGLNKIHNFIFLAHNIFIISFEPIM